MTSDPLHVAIAGAGLLGRLLAWRLTKLGHKVWLYDQHPFSQPRAAAFTAAGMVSPLSELVAAEPVIYHLGMRSLALWREWLAELGHSNLMQHNGSLVLAHPLDQAELQQFYRHLQARPEAHNRSRWLDCAAIAALEPQLAHFEHGIFLPDETHLDNRGLLHQLQHVLAQSGATLTDQLSIAFDGQKPDLASIERLHQAGQPSHYDLWLDCRGVGARQSQPTLRGVRGEVLGVHCPEIQLQRPVRIMHPRYQLYVVPKPGQHFVIGATQIESADESPISLQSTLELGSALYALHPAFAEARIVETATNLRPAYPDNQPQIIRGAGFAAVNGLFRHGYLLAPALVEQLLVQTDLIPPPTAPKPDTGVMPCLS